MTALGVLLGIDIGMADGGETNGNRSEEPMDQGKDSEKSKKNRAADNKQEVFNMKTKHCAGADVCKGTSDLMFSYLLPPNQFTTCLSVCLCHYVLSMLSVFNQTMYKQLCMTCMLLLTAFMNSSLSGFLVVEVIV